MAAPMTKTDPASSDDKLSPQAFAKAFQGSSRKLWYLAAGILGSRSQAEDVLQEAAVTALQRLDSFAPGTNFEAWIGQIVRFTALNHARRHYRSREFGTEELARSPGRKPGDGPSLDELLELDPHQEHFDDSVTRALLQLGELARASFLLRTLMGLTYKEIAGLLGIPAGTAMSHVHRSRAFLRRTLESDAAFELCSAGRAS